MGLKDLSDNYKVLHSTLVCLLKTEADKAIISLKNERETSYATYISVQNELVAWNVGGNEVARQNQIELIF